jgi:hypothetical protein
MGVSEPNRLMGEGEGLGWLADGWVVPNLGGFENPARDKGIRVQMDVACGAAEHLQCQVWSPFVQRVHGLWKRESQQRRWRPEAGHLLELDSRRRRNVR